MEVGTGIMACSNNADLGSKSEVNLDCVVAFCGCPLKSPVVRRSAILNATGRTRDEDSNKKASRKKQNVSSLGDIFLYQNRDSNPESPAPEADALSIRPH